VADPGEGGQSGHGIHCGQLIFRKISTIGATRCQILRLKCSKFDFRWGSASDPAGKLAALPRPLAVFMGPTSKGRDGKGRKGKGRVGKGKGRDGRVAPSWGVWIRQCERQWAWKSDRQSSNLWTQFIRLIAYWRSSRQSYSSLTLWVGMTDSKPFNKGGRDVKI